MKTPSAFHYSFHVRDLDSTRRFYGDLLGCAEGRSTGTWVDFNFFGNQISAHLGPLSQPTILTRHMRRPHPSSAWHGCVSTQSATRTEWEKFAARAREGCGRLFFF